MLIVDSAVRACTGHMVQACNEGVEGDENIMDLLFFLVFFLSLIYGGAGVRGDWVFLWS